jgi:hypothetical protein
MPGKKTSVPQKKVESDNSGETKVWKIFITFLDESENVYG